MSTGLKAPTARGLARPAPVKKSGLARPTTGLTKTPSGSKAAGKLSGSREAIGGGPTRSASRGALRSSASSQSVNSGKLQREKTCFIEIEVSNLCQFVAIVLTKRVF